VLLVLHLQFLDQLVRQDHKEIQDHKDLKVCVERMVELVLLVLKDLQDRKVQLDLPAIFLVQQDQLDHLVCKVFKVLQVRQDLKELLVLLDR
jgi:hypothetical protein